MLESLVPLLRCPVCVPSAPSLGLSVFAGGVEGHVADGVLVCGRCEAWYPIEGDVLELVPPPLLDPAQVAAFRRRFAMEVAGLGLGAAPEDDPGRYAEQLKQRAHFDLYALEAPGFDDYTRLPFIQAASRLYLSSWERRIESTDSWLLDIGCGNGLCSFPMARARTVVGFDVSREAVRKATERARSLGLMRTTTFFVADGSALPFADDSFELTQTLGVLHHLPDPGATLREIVRVLQPGGLHFAVENNASAFRAIFDWMMRRAPLWQEEAGANPTFGVEQVREWASGLPVRIEAETTVFLPPHLVNLAGRWGGSLLAASDRVLSRLPWWRRQGGLLLFTLISEKPRRSGSGAEPGLPDPRAARREVGARAGTAPA